MRRLLVILMGAALVAGCESLQKQSIVEASGERLDRAWKALTAVDQPEPTTDHDSEIQQLFAQPFIDPLTRYQQRYYGDESRSGDLERVRREREQRCDAVAERYRSEPLTSKALKNYRAGYSFSCLQDVEAYARQLKKLNEGGVASSDPAADQRPVDDQFSQQLNDCYLLTAIRNFSEALKACREPADSGDLQAQTNMAFISYAFQDYESAHRWARQAAPQSEDASYLLGQLYADGKGVEQSLEEAESWYKHAATKGHAEAKALLDRRANISSGANVN